MLPTNHKRRALVLSLFFLSFQLTAQSRREAQGSFGVIASTSPDASRLGARVLAQGGNAVDAAIATAFAMAVTHPSAGNIGGGGFMLIHPSDGSPVVFIDYREKAPLAATLHMYENGGSRKNHRFVGVPGTVRGLSLAHEIFGQLSWKALVIPAVEIAKQGFAIHGGLANSLNQTLGRSHNDEFKRVYGKPDGTSWQAGDTLVLPDLGATLERIATDRTDGFYAGRTATLIAAEMKRGGGHVTAKDLALYRARVRVPIHFTYRGYDVYSGPPPSSGGITMAMMLQTLENFDLKSLGRWSPTTNHLIIEAMRRGYANRATYLGDSDFVKIPDHLTSKSFGKKLATSIDLKKATTSETLGPAIAMAGESRETTHFSVVDRTGMAVSNTYTLEAGFGSGVVVTGAGFLLNNEMGDFNPQPGMTNRRGMIGTLANQIAPGKRMLSSMTPTIVAKNGKPYLVTGSPGGRTIINTVLCVVINVIDFGMDLRNAIDAPRTDHEWFPERVRFVGTENPAHAELVAALRAFGHDIQPSNYQGDANSVLITDDGAHAVADSKWAGAAAAKK